MNRRRALLALAALPVGSAASTVGAYSSVSKKPYVIAEPCTGKKDTSCVDACPVDCIHPKKDSSDFKLERQLYINPAECIECGACVPVCPQTAIFASDELPAKWVKYLDINAEYYKRKGKKSKSPSSAG